MTLATLDITTPLSSAEFATVDLDRVTEVIRRHRLLADFLRTEGYTAALLESPANFAWLTVSDGTRRCTSSACSPALFVTADARVIVCNNVDTPLLFEHEVAGLGFQLKERPWSEPRHVMINDLCRGRKVVGDKPIGNVLDVGMHLQGMRMPLSEYDIGRLRAAGRMVAHAVEATARSLTPGRTEADIAGELAHRLVKHNVHPERLQVVGDGRGDRFRHWTYSDTPAHKFCTISAVARYQGLHVGAARTVSFGDPSSDLLHHYQQAALVTATGMFFSQAGWELFEVWNRVKRIYEKCGAVDEWRLADQADVVEYEFGCVPMMPTSEFKLFPGVPVYWHPSVGPVMMGETVLVTERGAELLTPSTSWPTVSISVKGVAVEVPGILVIPGTNGATPLRL
ncbi:MAG TPA: M24 family metallopeptidase [Planctomycetaceae bacterium]|nr:M24 family metallopeptidase [Planctomycetaceae bacterium]